MAYVRTGSSHQQVARLPARTSWPKELEIKRTSLGVIPLVILFISVSDALP